MSDARTWPNSIPLFDVTARRCVFDAFLWIGEICHCIPCEHAVWSLVSNSSIGHALISQFHWYSAISSALAHTKMLHLNDRQQHSKQTSRFSRFLASLHAEGRAHVTLCNAYALTMGTKKDLDFGKYRFQVLSIRAFNLKLLPSSRLDLFACEGIDN